MKSEVNQERCRIQCRGHINTKTIGLVKNGIVSHLKIHFLAVLLLFCHGLLFSLGECSDQIGQVDNRNPKGIRMKIGIHGAKTFELKDLKESGIMYNLQSKLEQNPDGMKAVRSDLFVQGKKLNRRTRSDGRLVREIGATFDMHVEGMWYIGCLFYKYGNEKVLSIDHLNDILDKTGLQVMTNRSNHKHNMDDQEGVELDHESHGDDDHDHEGHDQEGHVLDHKGHDHDHEGHDHDHEGHDHDHEGHDHDHEDHDHEGHDHDHEGHDHDHEGHDHDHEGHDHDHDHNHEGHVHKREAANDTENEEQCLTTSQLLYNYGFSEHTELSQEEFLYLCPALLYQLDSGACKEKPHHHRVKTSGPSKAILYVYTMISVLIISLCALFGILCIPKKGRTHYNLTLQFLMALAMGSMSGDGMLHLIPHSMSPHTHEDEHDDDTEEDGDHAGHLDSMYKGLMALVGVYAFFFLERVFAIIRARSDAKKEKNRNSGMGHAMISQNDNYGNSNLKDDESELGAHGHSHEGMFSCTSLAMMIIVGDMFHNFCDGLAIGAAFYGSLSLGLSTSIAVFCHELPHEIGDFAVLIKSGMKSKRAIAFNMLSTVPCFFGATIGLELGSLGDSSSWIFALVGGMFMYISLVDLVPEMTKAYVDINGPWFRYMILHWIGMISGVLIMLILGIYEEDLQRILT